jgi:hypothetical protein
VIGWARFVAWIASFVADGRLPALQIVSEEQRERYVQGVLLAATRQESWSGEYQIVLPNGTLRWIRGEISPEPELAVDGSTVFTGIWQDVTLLKQAGARLREITESIPVAVYQYHSSADGHQTMLFAARLLTIMRNLAEELMLDANAFCTVHPDDRSSFFTAMALR